MQPRFLYQKLPKYPHLAPEDVKIWERFITAYPVYFERVDYDLKVGTPRAYPEAPNDKIKEDLEYLSRKRIDVVGYRGNEIHIIELKPRASFEAIGQIIGYTELFLPFVKPENSISMVLITDTEIPDIAELCFKKGIQYFIV